MLRCHHHSAFSYNFVSLVACIAASLVAQAQDAGDRGLLDDTVSTLAGGNPGDGAANATTVPLLQLGGGIVHDSSNNIYFTEGNRILKLAPSGALAVFAGSTVTGYTEGAKGSAARFALPQALAIDAANNLYVSDSGNFRIRKIAPDGTATTLAGNGNGTTAIVGIGGAALDAPLPDVAALGVNSSGDVFFLSSVNACIYKVTAATGVLSLVAGNGSTTPLASGTVASGASLGGAPLGGLALLGDGSLIYAASNAIYNIRLDGTSVIIAGAVDVTPGSTQNLPQSLPVLYPDDGTRMAFQSFNLSGVPLTSNLNVGGVRPGALAVDGSNIYFIDRGENRIRSFAIGGAIQTVFGERSEGGQTTAGGFRGNNSPAATNTPRKGLVVSAGASNFLQTLPSGDDVLDTSSLPNRIFTGPNGIAETTASAADVQGAAPGAAVADDQTPRNDDPKFSVANGSLTVAGGLVTFVDDGNFLVRQFMVNQNVNTVAGATAPFRAQNLPGVSALSTQLVTDTAPVLARAASIFSPGQLARDPAGNFYFDAFDRPAATGVTPIHKIYKLDVTTNPAAPTVTAIAGAGLTNGLPSNGGDGGPAQNAALTGLGAQIAVLPDGTLLFADTVPQATTTTSTHTIRAVSPPGVLSTIAGAPTIPGNLPIDADIALVKADGSFASSGNFVAPNRVGFKPSQVLFNAPEGIIATTLNDFVVADTGNSRVVVVAGGVITQDIPVSVKPTYLAQSGTNLFFASATSGAVGKIDLSVGSPAANAGFLSGLINVSVTGTSMQFSKFISVPATTGLSGGDVLVSGPGFTAGAVLSSTIPPNFLVMNVVADATAGAGTFVFSHNAPGVRGLALGANGLFVLDAGGTVRLASSASLTAANGTLLYTFPTGLSTPTGLAASGNTVLISEKINSSTGDIRSFTDTGTITPAPVVSPFIGPFLSVTSGASQLAFSNFAPIAFSGAKIVAGDDSIQQFRLITPQSPAPSASATVLAGAGIGAARVATADGEPATNAADIGIVGGIAVDSSGAVFFSDQKLNTVRRISGGAIATIAGAPGFVPAPFPANSIPNGADGAALTTTFNKPAGLAFNGTDFSTLFVADEFNNLVRKIVKTDGTGMVVRVAGIIGDGPGEGGDQLGPLQSRLFNPIALTFDPNGDMYIAESFQNGFITPRIHLLSRAGIVTTLAGGNFLTPTYTPLDALSITLPQTGMALDPSGRLYVAAGLVPTPYICRVAAGQIQVVAGDLIDSGFNGDGLSATQTLLNFPLSIVFTPGNGLVFTDVNNNRVRAIANLAMNGNSPPSAVIVAKPDHLGTTPFLVQLDGSQSTDPDGDIVSYQWDFGDNTTGNGPQVEHTYTTSGSFVVTLTVTDSAGNASTAQLTVFSAMPLINSSSSGRGSFSVGFGKSAGKDTFSISMKGVNGMTNQPGKPFTLFIGSFSITGTVAGGPRVKPGPAGKASATVAINASKKTISASVKNASLAAAFTALGVNNQNTIGSPTVLVPVVISVNNGALVVGDKLLFSYKTRFNGKAMGKFSQ